MVHEMQSERQTYTELLEHEVKKVLRMLRTFPAERFERLGPERGGSARDVARQFASHVRRIHELSGARRPDENARATHTRAGIMLELEAVYLGTYLALDAMPPFRWHEVVPSPTGLAPWRQARRGELLWVALNELERHARVFARHARAASGTRASYDSASLEVLTLGA